MDIKNINNLKIYSELLESVLDASDEDDILKYFDKIYIIIQTLSELLSDFNIDFKDFLIISGGKIETILLNKIKNTFIILLDFINNIQYESITAQLGNYIYKILSILHKKDKTINNKNNINDIFQNIFLRQIIINKIKTKSICDYLIGDLELDNHDCFYLSLQALYNVVNNDADILNNKVIYKFMSEIITKFENDNVSYFNFNNQKEIYSLEKDIIDIYTMIINNIFIKSSSDKSITLLNNITKYFNNMDNPSILASFVIDSYSKNNKIEVKILSLNALIILIAKYSFNYEKLYANLYDLLREEFTNNIGLFSNKYSIKFFKILEISLRSTKVNIYIIKAFIKILLKLIFKVKSSQAIWISFFVFNIIKKHKSLKNLFMSTSTLELFDDYNIEFELNNTQNFNFKYWEINNLKVHYIKEIKLIYENFLENLEKMDFINLEEYYKLDNNLLLKKRENNILNNN